MKYIKLNHDKLAIVDDSDYDDLIKYNWKYDTSTGYAKKNYTKDGKPHSDSMHRFIMKPPDNMCVDHKNRNKLDNRRSNLRICTQAQNSMNRKANEKKFLTDYKGVCWDIRKKLWRATIGFENKNIAIGLYETDAEAALEYNKYAKMLYGEFACLNEVDESKAKHASEMPFVIGKTDSRKIRRIENKEFNKKYRKIPILMRNGSIGEAIVDKDDYNDLTIFSWYENSKGSPEAVIPKYIRKLFGINKIRMAKYIYFPWIVGTDYVVDNRNGNKLDCRKENIDIVTKTELNKRLADRKHKRDINDSARGVRDLIPYYKRK